MAHLSSTSHKREIMKRWLFIVLIFSMCFNQRVTSFPSPDQTLPPALIPSVSSSLFPSIFASGPRGFFESISSTFGNAVLSVGSGLQAILSGVPESVGSLISSLFGTGRVNSGNQRTSNNQFQPLNQLNNGGLAVPNIIPPAQTPTQLIPGQASTQPISNGSPTATQTGAT